MDLGFIGFFACAANFFIAKISGDKADERYKENCNKAKAFTFDIATILIFSSFVLLFYTKNPNFSCILFLLIYAALFNIYGIKLYRLEEK